MTTAQLINGTITWAEITPLTCNDVDLRNVKSTALLLAEAATEHTCHANCPERSRHELVVRDFQALAATVAGDNGPALAASALAWASTRF
jgi:hypothetical protein